MVQDMNKHICKSCSKIYKLVTETGLCKSCYSEKENDSSLEKNLDEKEREKVMHKVKMALTTRFKIIKTIPRKLNSLGLKH